ncbi:hypothetical protein B0I35DRAFT_421810 [Stachybotrys elegans]|uniref:Uncharacterized protein n=1 Tax=Stachybotrys elegans TaxID=80388 RepID=A0A8K0WUV2_9HYPO|nr:hypothetical protein B0I35DRAFT_421810 [Stachybotrys elegans]
MVVSQMDKRPDKVSSQKKNICLSFRLLWLFFGSPLRPPTSFGRQPTQNQGNEAFVWRCRQALTNGTPKTRMDVTSRGSLTPRLKR